MIITIIVMDLKPPAFAPIGPAKSRRRKARRDLAVQGRKRTDGCSHVYTPSAILRHTLTGHNVRLKIGRTKHLSDRKARQIRSQDASYGRAEYKEAQSLFRSENASRDIKKLQALRLAAGAAPRYVNMEIETLRGILRRNQLWEHLRSDISMLKTHEEFGVALSEEEVDRLLDACRASQSRNLYPAVYLAVATGMRFDEIRLLRWKQIDFRLKVLTVGHSKTPTGTGRKILLNREAMATLKEFANLFPDRQSDHYLFPTEKCGGLDSEGKLRYYNRNPTKPIVTWKTAWNSARRRAKHLE
jgi:integrase